MAHSVENHDGRADFIKSILDVEVKEMPKTKALGVYADRKEAVRRVINVGLARSGLTGKDLDRRNIINRNTLVKRKAEGETIRLGEIWALDRVLHFTDDEILQMFGRGGEKWCGYRRFGAE